MLDLLTRLGIRVFERGWLSSNNILIIGGRGDAALVDTGYAAHADMTVALTNAALDGAPLDRIVNTHLHSDHCGGNAALHERWGSDILVPAASFDAAQAWDQAALSFTATDQRCDRFTVHGALACDSTIRLGDHEWEIHAAPGHDPHAVMLFEPAERVLISGDALWERRVSVIFPELAGEPGFAKALKVLEAIERLAPQIVVPGHGRPFSNAARAIAESKQRLIRFRDGPRRHERYAVRALTMFHMLEHRRRHRRELASWIAATPVLSLLESVQDPQWVDDLIHGMVQEKLLNYHEEYVCVPHVT